MYRKENGPYFNVASMGIYPKLVHRIDWGAAIPRDGGDILPTPNVKVIITRIGIPPCVSDKECNALMCRIQKYHMDRGMDDIPYSFVVVTNGTVYEGRGWQRVVPTPDDRPELKGKSIVFAHLGNFPEWMEPYRVMMLATRDLLFYGIVNDFVADENIFFPKTTVIPSWLDNGEFDFISK